MPSQKEVKWSELRVGVTVVFATIVLGILILLMTGSSGLFSKKLTLIAYFDNAGGLRKGAPVQLEGVTVGNVKDIRIVGGRPLEPVQVIMNVGKKYADHIRKDSTASLSTAGVLGETFVDIGSKLAQGPPAVSGDTLAAIGKADIFDMVKSGQGTLQNMDTLLKRLDRIVFKVENGEGSVGKILNDPELYNRINTLVSQLQATVDEVTHGKGSIAKLINNDDLYQRVNASILKLDRVIDGVDQGKGTVGKLMKDPALYNQSQETISKANKLMDDINAGKGTIGRLAKDDALARKLESTVDKLNAIADQINSGQGSAGKIIRDPSLYNNADQMLVETRSLIKALRENPKKYLTIHFKVF